MVNISLIDALQKQIAFCKKEEKYRCGVYTTSYEQRKIVMEVIKNLEPNARVKISTYDTEAIFNNGSFIKAVTANSNARGNKFNGLIIENGVERETIENIIYPTLLARYLLDKNEFESNSDFDKRVDYADIGYDDVEKSKEYKNILYVSSSGLYPERDCKLNALSWSIRKINNYLKFEKEYMSMFYENNYDHPVVEKELNGEKVLLYEAWGIPRDTITYSTEFINKTKQTYLNIVGKYENEAIGFKNDINVHLEINTHIYDGYEVLIQNGLIQVVLHEIKNEIPDLKDYGVWHIS